MRVGFSTVFHEKLRICHNKNIHCMRIGTLWVGSAARPLNQSVQMRLGHCWKGKHQVVQRATANFRDPYTLRQEPAVGCMDRSEEHTSELQSQSNLVCRLLLEKKK